MLDAYIIEEIKKKEEEKRIKFEEGRRIWQEVYIPSLVPQKEPFKPEGEEEPYKIEISMIKGYLD